MRAQRDGAASATLIAAVILFGFTPSASAIERSWDGGAGTLSWHDAGNWDPDGVPLGADDVVIDAPQSITIIFSTGTTTINSLACEESITLAGGTLGVTTTALMHGTMTLNGGRLQGGTWDVTAGSLLASSNSNNRLTGVTVNGDLTLSATSARVRIEGGTTFQKAHLSGNTSVLAFAPGQTLTGEIIFEGAAVGTRAVEMNGASGTLTIAPTGVIRTGAGLVGTSPPQIGPAFQFGGAMTLINNGLISSQVAGRTLVVAPAVFTNNATIEAAGGGTLNVTSPNWSNAGEIAGTSSTINLSGAWSNPGAITLNGGTINLGGTFNATGPGSIGTFINNGATVNITGTINNAASTLLLDGGTGSWNLKGGTISGGQIEFDRDAVLNITSDADNRLTGVAVNGDLILSATSARLKVEGGTTFEKAHLSGNSCALAFAPGQILTGEIIFEGSAIGTRAVEMNGSSGTLTIGPTGVIRTAAGFASTNPAQIGPGFQFGGTMTLINNGAISSQVAGRTIVVAPAAFTNNLLAEATGGATLNITSSNWTNAGEIAGSASTINLSGAWSNPGAITLNGGTINLGGTFNATGPGSIGTFINNGATVNITGTINNAASTLLLDGGTGSWNLKGGTISGGEIEFDRGAVLNITSDADNRLTGVAVNGDLILSATSARLKVEGGTTFEKAHLSGNSCALAFAPGQILTGEIIFEGAAVGTRAVEMNGASGTLTIGPTGVIRTAAGFASTNPAQIGPGFQFGGAMTLINNGLISSQVAGRTLVVAPAVFTNNATIEAAGGGTLNVTSPNWSNAGEIAGSASTINLSGAWSNPGAITLNGGTINLGGTFNATGPGSIGTFINNGATVNITGTINNAASTLLLDGGTGSWNLKGGTISGGEIEFDRGAVLNITSDADNRLTGVAVNGDLILSATSARLKVEGGTTFEKAHLSGNSCALAFAPGQILTGEIIFEGAAVGTRAVEMNGASGTLTIGPTGVIRTAAGFASTNPAQIGPGFQFGGAMTLINNGLISSQVAGRTLVVAPAVFTNNATIEAAGGGTLNVTSPNWSNAGEIAGSASTINLSGAWSNPGAITLNGGTINLGGTFNATGPGSIGTFINNGATVNITGTINNAASTLLLDGGTGSWNLKGGTISGGEIDFAGGAVLNMTSDSDNRLTGVTVNGDLTLSATSARVRIEGGTTFQKAHLSGNTCVIAFAPGQTLTGEIIFEGAAVGTRAVEMNGASGTLTIAPTGVIRTGAGLVGTSPPMVGVPFQYGGSMTLVNNGLISSQVSGRTINVAPAAFTNNAVAEAIGGGTLNVNCSGSNTGLMSAGGGNISIATSQSFTNTGTLNIGAARTVTVASGTLLNSGGGVVKGDGTLIVSAAALSNAATFGPGASPGILRVTGNYPQTVAGTLDIELGGLAPGSGHDQLIVTGTATLAGTLRLTFVNGFTPSNDDTFTVVSAGAATGAFGMVDVIGYPDCIATVEYAATTAVVKIVPCNLADLEVLPLDPPSEAFTSQPLPLSWTVRNSGTAAAEGPWTDRAYLSLDPVPGGDTPLAPAHAAGGPLAIGEEYVANVSPIVPVEPGSYWLIVRTDDADEVEEGAGEPNNVAVSSAPIEVSYPPAPNLVVTSVQPPAQAYAQGTIEISWTGENIGAAAAQGPWTDRVLLSNDPQVGNDVVLQPAVTFAGQVAPTATWAQTFTFTLPDLGPGDYWAFVVADSGGQVVEFGAEDDNVSTAAGPVQILPVRRPDLVVDSIAVPTPVTAGEVVAIQWSVRNDGNDVASGIWRDRIYLSDDGAIGNDRLIGDLVRIGPIAPQELRQWAELVQVPVDLAGPHRLIVWTDATDTVNESAESNNQLISQESIDVEPASLPDLLVDNIAHPDSGETGSAVAVSWTGRNDGPAATSGAFTDRLYLSSDAAYDAGDQPVAAAVRFAPVSPSGAYQLEASVSLPHSPGTWYFIARADANDVIEEGTLEGNNIKASTIPITITAAPLADLAAAIVNAPSTVQGDSSALITWSVTNASKTDAEGFWSDALYLSSDPAFDPADQLVRLQPSGLGSLAAGAAYERTASIAIPASYEPVTWHVIARTDSSGAIDEAEESNNFGASAVIEVTPTPEADFLVESATAPPAGTFGSTVPVQWTVRNAGDRPATPPWSDVVFISADAALSPDDPPIALEALLDFTLAPQETYERAIDLHLPLTNQLPAGDWYLIVKTDANLSVQESNDGNNAAVVGPIAIARPPSPDLAVELAKPPGTIGPGDILALAFEIRNTGDAPLDDTLRNRVYLSADGTIPGAVLLSDQAVQASLDPGAGLPIALELPIPDPASDTVFLVVCTDVLDAVVEEDEGNNCGTSAPIIVHRPDLLAVSVEGPDEAVAGSQVMVTWVARNTGQAAALPFWSDSLAIADAAAPQSGRLLVSATRSSPLEPGLSYQVTRTVTVPDDLEGTYVFTVTANAGGLLHESGDDSNFVAALGPIEITQPERPDLEVTSITLPAPLFTGQPADLVWTVTNTSQAAAVAGTWLDRVYASLDGELSANDALLGQFAVSEPLPPGAHYTMSETVAIPIPAGDYRLIVQTDATHLVNEGNDGGEGDNVSATAQAFTISGVTVSVAAGVDEAPVGTMITLSGTAQIDGTALPAGGVGVAVRVSVREFATTLSATTGALGQFSVQFQPLPDVGGLYSVAVRGPGGSFSGTQDQFVLWGTAAAPQGRSHVLAPGSTVQGSFTLTNLGDLPLTGVTIEALDVPPQLTVEPFLDGGSILAPLEARTLTCTIHALELIDDPVNVSVEVTSDQGTMSVFHLLVDVQPDVASLAAAPSPLSVNMVVGQVRLVEVKVRNVGLAATGVLNVALAPAPWLSLVSPGQISSLSPGERATVVLRLAPPIGLALGPYGAAPGLVITDTSDPSVNTAVNLAFNAVSQSQGDLLVMVTNEFSYWGTPPGFPDDAVVELRDVNTGQLVASGTATLLDVHRNWDPDDNNDGVPDDVGNDEQVFGVLFPDLLEGYYAIKVRAPQHGGFSSIVLNGGGDTTIVSAFVPRQVVTYTWTVVPIDFEDEYTITVTAEFETNVPAPVIGMCIDEGGVPCDPRNSAMLDFTSMESTSEYVELRVYNQGLVQAEDFHILVQPHPRYAITPLTGAPIDIPPMSSIVIPILMVDHGPGSDPERCAPVEAVTAFALLCDFFRWFYGPPLGVLRDAEQCGGAPGVPGDGPWANWGAATNFPSPFPGQGANDPAPFSGPTSYNYPCPCDVCLLKCSLAILNIFGADILGLIENFTAHSFEDDDAPDDGDDDEEDEDGGFGIGCGISVANCLLGLVEGDGLEEFVRCYGHEATGCVPDIPYFTKICQALKGCRPECCDPSDCTGVGEGDFPPLCSTPCNAQELFDLLVPPPESPAPPDLDSNDPVLLNLFKQYLRSLDLASPFAEFFGNAAWLDLQPPDKPVLAQWMVALGNFIEGGSDAGLMVSDVERAGLLGLPYPPSLSPEQVSAFLDRWNRTQEYAALGWTDVAHVPPGMSLDFIAADHMLERAVRAEAAILANAAEGFPEFYDGMVHAVELLRETTVAAEGICASVGIELDQTVAVTRQAFEATLVISNEGDSASLEGVLVDIVIKEADGETDATDRFFFLAPELDGINDVHGAGVLDPGASATARWVIIPGDAAAPQEPASYLVTGKLQYSLGGDTLVLPLFPVAITVLPNASLELRYFLETRVFGDDPFTPEIEPSVPFSLGLLARNNGGGIARNFRITAAQPQIVENRNGLPIDFDLIGTQVEDQEISPELNVNLGDLEPADVRVARWLMIASLQGEFTEFDAQVESLNGLNDPDFSLIDSLEIVNLHAVVRADVPADDLRPDFLANEQLDVNDLPDHLHTSGGAVEPVTPILDATVITAPGPSAQVSTSVGEGWFYIRIDDPYGAAMPLASVERSDGKPILLNWNAWQTNRIDRSTAQGTVERFVHIFDRGGDGSYTLHFAPDGTPPRATSWFAVDPAAGIGDVALALPSSHPVSDPRNRPLGGLTVQFTESIDPQTLVPFSVVVDGFDLQGNPVDLSGLTTTVELRLANLVADFGFDPPLPTEARYCVQLVGVKDPSGNLLTGDSRLDLTLLAGDATGDRRVNNTDVGGILSLVGTDPIDPSDLFQLRSDLNLDGRIDDLDVAVALDHRDNDARFLPDACLVANDAFIAPKQHEAVMSPGAHGPRASGSLPGSSGGAARAGPAGHGAAGDASSPTAPGNDAGSAPSLFVARFGDAERAIPVDFGRLAVFRSAPGVDVATLLADFAVPVESIQPWPIEGWWIADLPAGRAGQGGQGGFRSLAKALAREGLYVSPVLIGEDGGPMLVPPRILVAFDPVVPESWIDRVLDRHVPRLDVVEADFGGVKGLYRAAFGARDGLAVLELANALARRSDVRFCEPDLIFTGHGATIAAGGTSIAVLAPVQPGSWTSDVSRLVLAALRARREGASVLVLDGATGYRSLAWEAVRTELAAHGALCVLAGAWAGGDRDASALRVMAVDDLGQPWPRSPRVSSMPDLSVPAWPVDATGDGDEAAPALYAGLAAAALLADRPALSGADLKAELCAAARQPQGRDWARSRCGHLSIDDLKAGGVNRADLDADGRVDWLDLLRLLKGKTAPAPDLDGIMRFIDAIGEDNAP